MEHNDEKALLFHENWTSLEKFGKLEFDSTSNDSYGKFVLDSLCKGFGVTIGHSLRRVLLSSLINIASYAVRIEGISHEYESIRGVKEDILQILLNIKEIVFKPHVNEDICLELEATGPKRVTAKEIDTKGMVTVVNENQTICSLEQGAKIKIYLYLRMSRGFVTSEDNFTSDMPEGTIFLDSNHSPVQRISYEVQNTSVEKRTNYDKLIFELWTNGALDPRDAVCYAGKILCEYYRPFINFDEELVTIDKKEEEEAIPEENPNLKRTIDELELSVRSLNCLKSAKIQTIKDLVMKTENDILKTKNFGRKSLKEIKQLLASMGFNFGMTFDDSTEAENFDQ